MTPASSGLGRVEDGLTLGASESFGSFGVEVADFLRKEQQEVEREKSLLQERTRKMEEELVKERRTVAFCWFPGFFLRHTTVLVPPGAIDVFGPQRSGLRCAALLGTGAGAGWRVHEQLQCSDCWSQLSRSTTESVGILWQLRLFLPGLHHCDHSHREVGDGWILVDRAGSWAAVLLHLYFRGSVVLVQLLADGYQAR